MNCQPWLWSRLYLLQLAPPLEASCRQYHRLESGNAHKAYYEASLDPFEYRIDLGICNRIEPKLHRVSCPTTEPGFVCLSVLFLSYAQQQLFSKQPCPHISWHF